MTLKQFCFGIILLSIAVQAQDMKCSFGRTCILLRHCPALYELLHHLHDNKTKRILRTLHCGFEKFEMKDEPKVCCLYSLNSRNVEPTINNLLPRNGQCGRQNIDKIVGGSHVEMDEHPWMALLRYDSFSGWNFHCGGALISSRYVLTAAHCVTGDLPGELTHVRLGEYNISSKIDCQHGVCNEPAQDVRVQKVISHEDYDSKHYDSKNYYQYHDIGLVRLAKTVRFNYFTSPICLPLNQLKNNHFTGYTNMEVCGWGHTSGYGSRSDVKKKLKVRVMDYITCRKRLKQINATSQMCVSDSKGHGPCEGDSGGPLMGPHGDGKAWIIAGIISRGAPNCANRDVPTIYTRVGNYVDWILSKMEP